MIQRMWSRVIAVVVCGAVGVLLAPGCDQLGLGTCNTSGGGGADTGDEAGGGTGGGDEVPAAGCTPSRSCTDMFDACHDKGKPCTRIIEGSTTLCGICLRDCLDKNPYRTSECYKCGFDDL